MDEKLEQVLHKVELLCEQNEEFKANLVSALQIPVSPTQLVSLDNPTDNFASVMRLQHSHCRTKARNYYKDIKDTALQYDLINDYSQMLWYKSIFEVGKYFVYVNYQIENMLNYYMSNTDYCTKVRTNPTNYCKVIEITSNYKLTIDCFSYFFDKNQDDKPLAPSKIKSLWAKILYYVVDTSQEAMLEQQKSNFNSIITIRNEENHANSNSEKLSTKYWQGLEDSFQYAFIEAIIKTIRNSIIRL